MNEFLVKNNKQNLKKSEEFRTTFIKCPCDNEILVCRYDVHYDSLDISVFESKNSFSNKLTWYQKIRYIYNLLKTGHPYTDQIVLQRNQIEELKGFLNTI